MFAQRSVYVNELGMIVCVSLMCWGISNTAGLPQIALHRHTYSFNAHAMEHVENILCWNIARWTLSIGAASQASYCRIHHTDPHLQRHTRETFSTSTQTSPQVKSWEQRSLFCWIVWGAGCAATHCGRVLQLFRRTVGLCLEDEWAQYVPQYALVILFVSSNHQHHIITALFIWEEHYKCWTEHFICFLFSWLLMFLQHYSALNHGDSLSCQREDVFSSAGWCPITLCQQYRNCNITSQMYSDFRDLVHWPIFNQYFVGECPFLDFSIKWYLTLYMDIHVFALCCFFCFFCRLYENTTILGWVHWVGELEMSLNAAVTCWDKTAEFY